MNDGAGVPAVAPPSLRGFEMGPESKEEEEEEEDEDESGLLILSGGITMGAAVLNILLVVFLLRSLWSCGIYAFLQRGSGSGQAIARGRTIIRDGIELSDINKRSAVIEFLADNFMPGVLTRDTYVESCTFSKLYGPEYTYGRLSTVPAFTIRVLGDDPDEWGCEAPYYSFYKEHKMNGRKLHAADDCPTSPQPDERYPGAFMIALTWGTECPDQPSVPPMSLSGCDYWLDDPVNGYLDPPTETQLCLDNQTFCELILFNTQVINRTTANIPGAQMDGQWDGRPTADQPGYDAYANTQRYFKSLSNISALDWWVSDFYQHVFSLENAGVQRTIGSLMPVDPGPANFPEWFTDNLGVDPVSRSLPGPPLLTEGGRGGPVWFLPRNESCYDLFSNLYGPAFAKEMSAHVRGQLENYIGHSTPAIIATAYMPLATGKVLSMVYHFNFLSDGTVKATEEVHVKSLSNSVSLGTRATLCVLAFLVVFLSTMNLFDSIKYMSKRIKEVCTPGSKSKISISGVPQERLSMWLDRARNLFFRFHQLIVVVFLSGVLAFAVFSYTLFAIAYSVLREDETANRVVAVSNVCKVFYASILIDELGEVFFVSEALSTYFSDFWNWVDLMAVVLGLVSFAVLENVASEVGWIDDHTNSAAYPPYSAFREETAIQQVETADRVTILISFCVFVTAFRMFKFLSISPVLVVPFGALVRSKNELSAFFVTLTLFLLAFACFFTYMFGGDVDGFNGIPTSMDTLFSAAFDALDDSVFDRLNEMDSLSSFVGQLMIYVFVCLVTISFMNMLITITMEFYMAEREEPDAKDFLRKDMKKAIYRSLRRIRRVESTIESTAASLAIPVQETVAMPRRRSRKDSHRRSVNEPKKSPPTSINAQASTPDEHDTPADLEEDGAAAQSIVPPAERPTSRVRNRLNKGRDRARSRAHSRTSYLANIREQEEAAAARPRAPTTQRLRFRETLVRDSSITGEDIPDGGFATSEQPASSWGWMGW